MTGASFSLTGEPPRTEGAAGSIVTVRNTLDVALQEFTRPGVNPEDVTPEAVETTLTLALADLRDNKQSIKRWTPISVKVIEVGWSALYPNQIARAVVRMIHAYKKRRLSWMPDVEIGSTKPKLIHFILPFKKAIGVNTRNDELITDWWIVSHDVQSDMETAAKYFNNHHPSIEWLQTWQMSHPALGVWLATLPGPTRNIQVENFEYWVTEHGAPMSVGDNNG